MKCYTVTDQGIVPGIAITREPHPHVCIGDPDVEYNHRRVAVDAALSESAADGSILSCSYTVGKKDDDRRGTSYRLVPPSGADEDQALVKLEVHAPKGARIAYDVPRDTRALAIGWFSPDLRPRGSTPVQLIVLKKGGEVRVSITEDIWKGARPLFSLRFDGAELRLDDKAVAPAA